MTSVNSTLIRWSQLTASEAENEILACCGSRAWARDMTARRPIVDAHELFAASDETWLQLGEADWMEAFCSHPRIGGGRAEQPATARSAQWSAGEQSRVADENDAVKLALADGNREYEKRFGHIFIVCASGKSAAEILANLRQRLHNDPQTELREAAEQQRQITQLRLRKWLAE